MSTQMPDPVKIAEVALATDRTANLAAAAASKAVVVATKGLPISSLDRDFIAAAASSAAYNAVQKS